MKEHYKKNLAIPLLDHIINELDSRFNSESSAEFMKLLPSSVCTSSITTRCIPRLLELYEDDHPSSRSLNVELDLWQNKWKREIVLAKTLNTAEKSLSHTDRDYFPNMVTLPVTSCECERSISLLRHIMTNLRSAIFCYF